MTQDPNMPGNIPPGNVPPVSGMPMDYSSPEGGYMGPPPTPDERTMAMICHITGIFGWLNWVGPLIFYSTRKDSAFIQDQSKQTLNWALTVLICFFAPILLIWCPPLAGLFALAVLVTNLIFCIIAAVRANQGIAHRFPFSIKFVK